MHEDTPDSDQASHNETGTGGKPPGGSLHVEMRRGVAFWTMANLASRFLKIAVHIALAWWLERTDYGIVAMTIAFMTVLQYLSEFGVGLAVIQKKDMDAAFPTTAFWINFVMSLLMTAVAWAGADWLAAFYNEPRVVLLVKVSSLGFPITALRTIPMAVLRKKLSFGRYAGLDTGWQSLAAVLTLAFAWCGAGYWSLVIPQMIAALLFVPVWFVQAQWRPAFRFETTAFREIFSFSLKTVAT